MKQKSSIEFEVLPEFNRDLKELLKKFRSLRDDLEVLKMDLRDEPGESPPFSYRINNLGVSSCIIKVKKMACKALKGKGVNSGLRLVYAYFPEITKITFIELYHKSDKANEDRDRILKHFS